MPDKAFKVGDFVWAETHPAQIIAWDDKSGKWLVEFESFGKGLAPCLFKFFLEEELKHMNSVK